MQKRSGERRRHHRDHHQHRATSKRRPADCLYREVESEHALRNYGVGRSPAQQRQRDMKPVTPTNNQQPYTQADAPEQKPERAETPCL